MAETRSVQTCGPAGTIAYADALAMVEQAAPAMVAESCLLSEAQDRVLAESVMSPMALPTFDNAAMDGYALPAGNFAAGTLFGVRGLRVAGDTDAIAALGVAACEITTGACLPHGRESVVPVEQVDVVRRGLAGTVRRIRLRAPVQHGQHVRRIGADVTRGPAVLASGTRVQATHTMLLAALGVDRLTVARRPRVAVIGTGRELVDDPAQALQPGQIRNATGPYLRAQVQAAGAELVYAQTVSDDEPAWQAALQRALAAGAEVVISSGAVSMGRHDFVPGALVVCGAQVLFHKVAIRPGRPLLFARLPGGALYFGLPGNPVSTAVGMRFFVEPALRAMQGLQPERPQWLPLAHAIGNRRLGFRHYLKARVSVDIAGRCTVVALDGQECFRILPLAQANAWLVLSETDGQRQAGDRVQVHGLGHAQPLLGMNGG